MKIIINHNPEYELSDTFTNIELENFSINCELLSDNEATATDVINMVYKALLIEGYAPESIEQAMIDVATYKAHAGHREIISED